MLISQKPEEFRPHSLRALYVTYLANDEGVSAKETMLASRHSSISANAAYQQSTSRSESNRYKALGYIPPKTSETLDGKPKITPIPTTSTQQTMDEVTEKIENLENEIETERTRSQLHEKFHQLSKKVEYLTDTMKKQRNIIAHLKEKDNNNQDKIRNLNKLVETMKEEIQSYTLHDVKNIFEDDWDLIEPDATTAPNTTPASNNTTKIHHCSTTSTSNIKPQAPSLHVSYNTGFNHTAHRHCTTNNYQNSTDYRVKNPYAKKTADTKPQAASLHVSYNTGFNPSSQRHNHQDSTYYRARNPYLKKKW